MPPVKRLDTLLKETAKDSSSVDPFDIGAANHPSERRADLVADRGLDVLRTMSTRLPSAQPIPTGSTPRIQRAATAGSAAGGRAGERTSASIDAALGSGRRFEPEVQERIRRATGHDASGAHVHTDARADRLARSVNARAFTVSNNVFFAKGEYRPDTDEGMHTLLHESAHLAEGTRDVRRTIRRTVSVTAAAARPGVHPRDRCPRCRPEAEQQRDPEDPGGAEEVPLRRPGGEQRQGACSLQEDRRRFGQAQQSDGWPTTSGRSPWPSSRRT